jgi:hypothetical protein
MWEWRRLISLFKAVTLTLVALVNSYATGTHYTCFVLYRSDLRLSCNDGVFWWRNGEAVRPSAISGFTRYDLSSQMLKISDIRGNNPEVNYTCGRSPEAISDTFTVKVRGKLSTSMRTTDGETLSAVNVSQLLSDQQEVLNLRVLSTFSPDPSRIPGEDVTCREWHVNAVGLGGKCFSNCILVNCPCENNATSCQKTPLNSNVNLITTVDGKDGANITLNLAAFGLIAGGHPVVVTYKGSQVIRSTSCTTVEPSRMQVELAKVTLRDFPVTPSSSATAESSLTGVSVPTSLPSLTEVIQSSRPTSSAVNQQTPSPSNLKVEGEHGNFSTTMQQNNTRHNQLSTCSLEIIHARGAQSIHYIL